MTQPLHAGDTSYDMNVTMMTPTKGKARALNDSTNVRKRQIGRPVFLAVDHSATAEAKLITQNIELQKRSRRKQRRITRLKKSGAAKDPSPSPSPSL